VFSKIHFDGSGAPSESSGTGEARQDCMAVRLSSISAASQQRLSSRRRVLAQSAKVSGSARARASMDRDALIWLLLGFTDLEGSHCARWVAA
jgi:hypothetical protein